MCLDISVDTPKGYGLVGEGSIPCRGKFFLFSIAFRPALGHTQPLIQWLLGALSVGVQRPVRKAGHSPPCSVEFKNRGAIPPHPHMPS
jgi:hypothetical protein